MYLKAYGILCLLLGNIATPVKLLVYDVFMTHAPIYLYKVLGTDLKKKNTYIMSYYESVILIMHI